MAKRQVTRRSRERLRRDRAGPALLDYRFRQILNPFPPLEMVTAEQIATLHEASMTILETIGLDFLDDEALDLWQQAGARVDRSDRHVWLDRNLVLELVARTPASFSWRARNPERSVFVGENSIAFSPQGGVAYVTNFDSGRRPGTMEDYTNFLKLVQMSNVLHFAGEQLVAPHEVPASLRHLKRLHAAFTYTDKAVLEAAHGRVITSDSLEMARLVFGDEGLASQPAIGGVINVNSPLRYDERMLGGLITYARAGQVCVVTPFILAGAMSPISMAAAIAQQNAEALAGIALIQLVRPGAPAVYGGFTTNVDMKSGSPAFGTPEGAWALLVGAQLARRYNLPYRGSGSLNTSKVPDAQSAYETNWTIWPAVMAHTNFIMHAVGWLESGLTVSYEKFIIDLEGLAMFQHFLSGLTIDEETLALDMIAEVGPGGHHFGTPHTQARYSTEFFASFLSNRLGYDTWLEAGGLDASQRAHRLWKILLDQYEPPAIDPGLKEALDEFVERRLHQRTGEELYQ